MSSRVNDPAKQPMAVNPTGRPAEPGSAGGGKRGASSTPTKEKPVRRQVRVPMRLPSLFGLVALLSHAGLVASPLGEYFSDPRSDISVPLQVIDADAPGSETARRKQSVMGSVFGGLSRRARSPTPRKPD